MAHRATEGFNLPFIGSLLAFGQFQRLEDLFHVVERFFELRDDSIDFLDRILDGLLGCRLSRRRQRGARWRCLLCENRSILPAYSRLTRDRGLDRGTFRAGPGLLKRSAAASAPATPTRPPRTARTLRWFRIGSGFLFKSHVQFKLP